MSPSALPHRPTALRSEGSRALIVGSGHHVPGSALPDVPAVDRTVRELGRTLVERCGLRADHLRSLTDPRDPGAVGTALTEVALQATDMLLVYYVGHGLVSSGNELYLATRATDDPVAGLMYNALPYTAVREALSVCPARSVVVVLDCCFSGRAKGPFGTAATHAFELASLGGTYVLASAAADEQALAPVGAPYTAFTGELLAFLRDGDRAGLPDLTLEAAYRHLRRALPRRSLPAPHRHLSGIGDDLVLAPNHAAVATRPSNRMSGAETQQAGAKLPCPYLGLRSFTADDAAYYFGRDRLVGDVLRKMADWSGEGAPIAVVGASGSGKSSLLQAGLLPAIRRGELAVGPPPETGGDERPEAHSSAWPHLSLTPGQHPLATLAGRLARGAGVSKEVLAERLREHPEQLSAVIRRALGRRDEGEGRLLVVVDQFEELFTQCTDEAERRAFITALCTVGEPDGPLPPAALVLLAVRADFYGQCLARPELAPTFRDHQVPVTPMTPDELRETIERPAAVSGHRLEEGLSGVVLRDLRIGAGPDDPTEYGFLPLLSYALEQTWAHSEGRDLLIQRYEDGGGVWNAITRQADLVHETLDADAREAARRLLLRMVNVSEGFEDTRRRADLNELTAGRPEAEAVHVSAALNALADARLITVDGRTAQIAHEALLRWWPKLRGWINEDRDGLRIHRRLSDAAREWDKGKKHDNGALLRGAPLATARERFADRDRRAELTPAEGSFLQRSVLFHRGRRCLYVAGVGVLVAALVSGFIAVRKDELARNRQDTIASRQLGLLADSVRDGDPAAALSLSLAAYDISHTPEAGASVLHSGVTTAPAPLAGVKGRVFNVAYSGDGRTVAASSKDRTVKLWDISRPGRPVAGKDIHTDGLAAIAYRPGGRTLAVQTAHTLTIWDVSNPAGPVSMASRASRALVPQDIAYSPDGSELAVTDAHGVVHLWDTHGDVPAALPDLTVGTADVHAVAFAPDGRTLAAATAATGAGRNTAAVTLWSIDTHGRAAKDPTATMKTSSTWSLAFNPQGTLLAAGGSLGSMAVWDTTKKDRPVARKTDEFTESGDGAILSISFKPDGRTFLAADGTGTVQQWEVAGGVDERDIDVFSSFPTTEAVYAVAYSPDGGTFVSGGEKGSLGLWSRPSPVLPGYLHPGGTDVPGSAFSDDGDLLAVIAGDVDHQRAQVWDLTDPHRPKVAATLPRQWARAAFIGGDHTMMAQDASAGTISLWNMSDPRHPAFLSQFRVVGTPTVSNDGSMLAVGVEGQPTISVFDIRTPEHPKAVGTIPVKSRKQGSQVLLHLLNDERLLVSDDDGASLWQIGGTGSPRRLHTFSQHPDLGGLAYNNKTHLLAMWDVENSLFLYDLSHLPHAEKDYTGTIPAKVQSAAFIGEQTLTVATANDRTITTWNVGENGEHTQRIGVVTGDSEVSGITLSPDGHMLAGTPGLIGQAHLWDISDPAAPSDRGTPPDPAAEPGEFSPDGRTLAMTTSRLPNGGDGIELTDYQPGDAYRYLCSLHPHTISRTQWTRLAGKIHAYHAPCAG